MLFISKVPSAPRQVRNCLAQAETNHTDVFWVRPSGGDAINENLVQWFSNASGLPISNAAVRHDLLALFCYYTIGNLILPRETINIVIIAENSAGLGQSASASLTAGKENNCHQILYSMY